MNTRRAGLGSILTFSPYCIPGPRAGLWLGSVNWQEGGAGSDSPLCPSLPTPRLPPLRELGTERDFLRFLAGNGKEGRRTGLQASLLPVLIPSQWPASSSSASPGPSGWRCLHTDRVTQIPGVRSWEGGGQVLKGHSHSSGKAGDGALSVGPTELSRGVCSLHPCLLRGHRAQALGRQERSRARRFGLQWSRGSVGTVGLAP